MLRSGMSQIAVLAVGVTLIGLTLVIVSGWLAGRLTPAQRLLLSATCLILYGIGLLFAPSRWILFDVAVLFGALGVVLLLERLIGSDARAVLVFVMVAAVVDIISFSSGLTRTIVDQYRAGDSDLLLYLSLVAPYRGRGVQIVGIADLIIGGTVATALFRYQYRFFPVWAAIGAGLVGALGVGLWRSGGVPAVPFIAGATMLLLWTHRPSGKALQAEGVGEIPGRRRLTRR
jgi:hypothetical protein